MPRFFFHIRDHRGRVEDEEGSEHPDIEHALSEAKASARDLAKQDIDPKKSTNEHCIEVCDADGHLLVTVPLTEIVEHPKDPALGKDCHPTRH